MKIKRITVKILWKFLSNEKSFFSFIVDKILKLIPEKILIEIISSEFVSIIN